MRVSEFKIESMKLLSLVIVLLYFVDGLKCASTHPSIMYFLVTFMCTAIQNLVKNAVHILLHP